MQLQKTTVKHKQVGKKKRSHLCGAKHSRVRAEWESLVGHPGLSERLETIQRLLSHKAEEQRRDSRGIY